MSQYQAGVCNIGGAEVARRRQVALIGGISYIALALFLISQNYSALASLMVFPPAMLYSVGFIQARKRFCFAYGLLGTFNFQKLGTITKVEDKAFLAADRKMAIKIIVQALGVALILTSSVALINSS